ncbi:MAG: hypothetical protein ACE5JX_22010, partial [Acidobacteriota bacterium]
MEAGDSPFFDFCPNNDFDNDIPGTVNPTLANFRITVVSTPVSGETNSVVSGQSAQVKVEALDEAGNVFTAYRGTIRFSSTDTGATLPADYTYTASDAGSHTFNVTLKTVSGTSPTRGLNVQDLGTSIIRTKFIHVWFRVSMGIEFHQNCDGFTQGSYALQTACNPNGLPQNSNFISLPDNGAVPCGVSIRVKNQSGGSAVQTTHLERGPGPLGRHYWNDGNVPTNLSSGCASDGLAIQLGQTFVNGGQPGPNRFGCPSPIPNNPPGSAFGQADIFWRFGQ